MRENKFKVWDKIDKSMSGIENWLYLTQDGRLLDGSPCNKGLKFVNMKEVEILFYTGLKDKNNVEIFEGDIVNYIVNGKASKFNELNFSGVVHWDSIAVMFKVDYYNFIDIFRTGLEVVGNIYQNSELLEEKL